MKYLYDASVRADRNTPGWREAVTTALADRAVLVDPLIPLTQALGLPHRRELLEREVPEGRNRLLPLLFEGSSPFSQWLPKTCRFANGQEESGALAALLHHEAQQRSSSFAFLSLYHLVRCDMVLADMSQISGGEQVFESTVAHLLGIPVVGIVDTVYTPYWLSHMSLCIIPSARIASVLPLLLED